MLLNRSLCSVYKNYFWRHHALFRDRVHPERPASLASFFIQDALPSASCLIVAPLSGLEQRLQAAYYSRPPLYQGISNFSATVRQRPGSVQDSQLNELTSPLYSSFSRGQLVCKN